MINEERERIREAARRYVCDQGPVPPIALLEQVARIVLEAKAPPPVASQLEASEALTDRKQRDGMECRAPTPHSSRALTRML